jgi:hypothetical protein
MMENRMLIEYYLLRLAGKFEERMSRSKLNDRRMESMR